MWFEYFTNNNVYEIERQTFLDLTPIIKLYFKQKTTIQASLNLYIAQCSLRIRRVVKMIFSKLNTMKNKDRPTLFF